MMKINALWVKNHRVLPYLLGVIVLGAFANCLHHSFVWDDEQFITKNVFVTQTHQWPNIFLHNVVAGFGLTSNLYRPFESFTHALDFFIWKDKAFGHHLTNILIHATFSIFLFLILKKNFSLKSSFMATLLYCLHPIFSQSVAYVSGRGDILGLLCLIIGLHTLPFNSFVTIIMAILAILSKESFALYWVFIVLYGYANRLKIPKIVLISCAAISAIYITLRLTALNFSNTLNFYTSPNILTEQPHTRILTFLSTIPKAILLWVAPFDLHHERSWAVRTSITDPFVLMGILVLSLSFLLTLFHLKRNRWVSMAVLWFCLALIPTSNLWVLINALFYDHWFILPSLGVVWLIAQSLDCLFRSRFRQIGFALTSLTIIWLCVLTYQQNKIWANSITLHSHILQFEPQSTKARVNLAIAYEESGNSPLAEKLYLEAIALDDSYAQTHHNLALIYEKSGDTQKALKHYDQAINIDPKFFRSWLNRSLILMRLNKHSQALMGFEKTISLYPYLPSAYLGLALIYQSNHETDKALEWVNRGLSYCSDKSKLQKLKNVLEENGAGGGNRTRMASLEG